MDSGVHSQMSDNSLSSACAVGLPFTWPPMAAAVCRSGGFADDSLREGSNRSDHPQLWTGIRGRRTASPVRAAAARWRRPPPGAPHRARTDARRGAASPARPGSIVALCSATRRRVNTASRLHAFTRACRVRLRHSSSGPTPDPGGRNRGLAGIEANEAGHRDARARLADLCVWTLLLRLLDDLAQTHR